MANVVTFIEGAAADVGRHGTVSEQAADLIRWAESSKGPGLEDDPEGSRKFSLGPDAGPCFIPFARNLDFVGRSDDLDRSAQSFRRSNTPASVRRA